MPYSQREHLSQGALPTVHPVGINLDLGLFLIHDFQARPSKTTEDTDFGTQIPFKLTSPSSHSKQLLHSIPGHAVGSGGNKGLVMSRIRHKRKLRCLVRYGTQYPSRATIFRFLLHLVQRLQVYSPVPQAGGIVSALGRLLIHFLKSGPSLLKYFNSKKSAQKRCQ